MSVYENLQDPFNNLKNIVFKEDYWKVERVSTQQQEESSGTMRVRIQLPVAVELVFSLANFSDAVIRPVAGFMRRQAIRAMITKLEAEELAVPDDLGQKRKDNA